MSTLLFGSLVALALFAVVAYAVYRWRQIQRVHVVEAWVRSFLHDRYGILPNDLSINCSNDTLWPVLVGFAGPDVGVRHRLQFSCAGQPSTFSLMSEIEETLEQPKE